MVGLAASGLQITAARPSIFFNHRIFKSAAATVFNSFNVPSSVRHSASFHVSSLHPFQQNLKSTSARNYATKANSEASEGKQASVLPIDLTGRFIYFFSIKVCLTLDCSKTMIFRWYWA